MNILGITLTTKTKEEFSETELGKCIKALGNNFTWHIQYLNKTPICKAYNDAVKAAQTKYDLFLFVHDDVSIQDLFIVKKLAVASSKADIVGLAGATDFAPKKPALWHLCSKDYSGQVAHKTDDGKVFMSNFGLSPQNVNVLDGLFLAVKPSVFFEKNVWFDERLPGFHHYDIKFCIDAKNAGLQLTTWPIWCIHNSPGLRAWTPEYLESERIFLELIDKKQQ